MTRTAAATPPRTSLEDCLLPNATTSERVRGLLAIGLHASDIANATGVTVSGLRNWGTGQAEPRPDAAISLDDLRATVKILLDGNMEQHRVAHWLRGWNPGLEARPLEIVRTRPMDVRAAAIGEALTPA
jgi:hypothetical protein